MNLAVASGKGGTGKTTLAVNLAATLSRHRSDVTYVDCDVEEPNGHLFLQPEISSREPVERLVPEVDEDKCNGCGKCGEICKFSAILPVGNRVLTFPDLCRGCGGCSLVCPTGAIREVPVVVGEVETGRADGIGFVQGRLRIGKVDSPLVIRRAKTRAGRSGLNVMDAPPGTACPVVETLNGCDYVILVTEPTPFGLSDLKLCVTLVRRLGMQFSVAINRCDTGDNRVQEFCRIEGVPVILEIPEDRAVAEAYARGDVIVNVLPKYSLDYEHLVKKLNTLLNE